MSRRNQGARANGDASPASRKGGIAWRALTPTILVPNFLQGLGQGAIIPTIPLAVIDMGGSYAVAVIASGMLRVGQLCSSLPTGWLITRFGEKPCMLAASVLTGAAGLGALLSPGVVTLMVAVFLIGCGVQSLSIARVTWVAVAIDVRMRGRTMSVMAGSGRLGMAVGPFIAAASFAVFNDVAVAFGTMVVTSGLVIAVVAMTDFPSEAEYGVTARGPGVLRTLRSNARLLLQLGTLASLVSTLRATRQILVPLIGTAIGMEAVTVALIVGVSTLVEVLVFYLGGVVIDTLGRIWLVVPVLVTFGVCHIILGSAQSLPASEVWFVTAAMITGLANGLSGGVLATMGADLADPRSPAVFLGAWRLVTEAGPAVVPLAVAALTAAVSLGAASASMGLVGLVGAVLFPRYLHRYLPEDPATTSRRVTT